MSEIRLAAKGREWKNWLHEGPTPGPTLVGELPYIGSEDKHLVAALCLHGQPFGFTWEDVEGLRSVAAYLAHMKATDGVIDADGVLSIAARIEALLPPKGSDQ